MDQIKLNLNPSLPARVMGSIQNILQQAGIMHGSLIEVKVIK
jgi:hypothetical protein